MLQRGVPLNGFDIITKAFEEYEMDMETVSRLTGLETDELMSLEGSEVQIAWSKIQEAADEEGVERIVRKEAARLKAEGNKTTVKANGNSGKNKR